MRALYNSVANPVDHIVEEALSRVREHLHRQDFAVGCDGGDPARVVGDCARNPRHIGAVPERVAGVVVVVAEVVARQ